VQVYVQHKMAENGQALCDALVNGRASIFVCGDGALMAKDVHYAFIEILVEHGGVASAEEGEGFMTNLTAQKRYLKDVWLA
jgi:sulfite reductase alpha subunit-like flavoprotein